MSSGRPEVDELAKSEPEVGRSVGLQAFPRTGGNISPGTPCLFSRVRVWLDWENVALLVGIRGPKGSCRNACRAAVSQTHDSPTPRFRHGAHTITPVRYRSGQILSYRPTRLAAVTFDLYRLVSASFVHVRGQPYVPPAYLPAPARGTRQHDLLSLNLWSFHEGLGIREIWRERWETTSERMEGICL